MACQKEEVVNIVLCKDVVFQTPSAILSPGQLTSMRAESAVFYNAITTTNTPRFKSAAAYMQFKKAQVYAGSTPNPVLPPQSSVIGDIQAASAANGCQLKP